MKTPSSKPDAESAGHVVPADDRVDPLSDPPAARWLGRLSGSFAIVAAVLAWEVYRATVAGAALWRVGLLTVAAAAAVAMAAVGVRYRHRRRP